jgi:hypothetical protein
LRHERGKLKVQTSATGDEVDGLFASEADGSGRNILAKNLIRTGTSHKPRLECTCRAVE